MSEAPKHIQIGQTDAERQQELTEQGRRLAARVHTNIAGLVANGTMTPERDLTAERNNQVAYASVGTPGLGEWHQVRHDRAVRVDLLAPKPDENGTYASAEGRLYVQFGTVGVRNGKPTIESGHGTSSVDVRFDADGTGHVSGMKDGFRYSVDHPNPRALGHDLPAAAGILTQAEDAIDAMIAETPASVAPAAPAAPEAQPHAPGQPGEGNPPIYLPL